MKKRILGLILTLAMVLPCMPIIAYAQTSGTCGENLTWTLDDEGTLTISGTGDMTDYYFNNIHAPWYDSRLDITNIIIEEGVTSIGKRAFMDCENLETVSIPASVTKSDFIAFDKCESLIGVYITDLAAWCDIDFFNYDCNPLYYAKNLYINGELAENITIPNSVEKIRDYAFYNCRSITDVSMSEGVKEIGQYAFARCTEIQNARISDSVETIGQSAFNGCLGLTSINIPEGVKSIGSLALMNINLSAVEVDENNAYYMAEDGVLFNKAQTKIILYPCKKSGTSYTIPENVTEITSSAFSGCKLLESVDIPASVNYIGTYAFRSCINITSLTIPDGVTEIKYGMVLDCEKLTSINIPESVNSVSWNVFDGTAYYNDESNWTGDVLYIDNCLIEAKYSLSGDYQIKDGTRVIAMLAFLDCEDMTGISIPESVTDIGFHAFDGTAYYKDDSNWTDNILYIDNCLIETKDSLSGTYQIKDGTRVIAERAFHADDKLTEITIPDSVISIDNKAFYRCGGLVDFVFKAPNAPALRGDVFPEEFTINIHEGYTGYTEENGYPADKIVVEPHDFADGVCSICGVKEIVPPIERIDESGDAKYAFRVDLGQEYENSYVYAAVYDADGVLISVNRVPLELTGDTVISLDKSKNDKTAKVFVWTDELQPILETAEEFPLNN